MKKIAALTLALFVAFASLSAQEMQKPAMKQMKANKDTTMTMKKGVKKSSWDHSKMMKSGSKKSMKSMKSSMKDSTKTNDKMMMKKK